MTQTAAAPVQLPSTTKITASPAHALRTRFAEKSSGRLIISDPKDHSKLWQVYLSKGYLHFANSAMGHQKRLSYVLQRYYPKLDIPLDQDSTDYDLLCGCWKAGQLTLDEIRKLLLLLTQEALVQILALPETQIQFENWSKLDPPLLTVAPEKIIVPLRPLITQWKTLWLSLGSPFHQLLIHDLSRFSKQCESDNRYVQLRPRLLNALSQKICLYEIATMLNMNLTEVAHLLSPFVQSGSIKVTPSIASEFKARPLVVCIDDNKTVQRNVKKILEASGFKVLGILEPAKALTQLVRHKPDLILMDINMPGVDGYELCRMLRQSKLLRSIPIVMVTGRDGMIDRLRAKVSGATDYLTKPFRPEELLVLVMQIINHDSTVAS
jgi:twitching motility two-component system response regulator PilG